MKLYSECTVKIVEKNNFSDPDGKTVEFNTNYLKNKEGEVLEINSTKDFSSNEGETGICVIHARKREGGGFKLSLREFIPNETIDLPETVIH